MEMDEGGGEREQAWNRCEDVRLNSNADQNGHVLTCI